MAAPLRKWEPVDGKCYLASCAQSGQYDEFISSPPNGIGRSVSLCGHFNSPNANMNTYGEYNTLRQKGPKIYWSWRIMKGPYSETLSNQASLRSCAQGFLDTYIIDTCAIFRGHGVPFVRPWWEFNGQWNEANVPGRWVWQLYNNGIKRAHNSDQDYINAHRRLYIIKEAVGGRSGINSSLSALGLPTLQDGRSTTILPAGFALPWSPHRSPSPGSSDNYPELRWPGADYVDWVGMDVYSIPNGGQGPNVTTFNQFMNANRGPNFLYDNWCAPGTTDADGTVREFPFMWGELGTRGFDSGPWHDALFDWCEARSKVKMMAYFNQSASDGDSLVSRMPNTRAVWVTRTGSSRYLKSPADVVDLSGDPTTNPDPDPPPTPTLPENGYSIQGANWANIGANFTYLMEVEASATQSINAFDVWLRGIPGGSGAANVKVVVYESDANGVTALPTDLLGVTNVVNITADEAPALYRLTCTPFGVTDGQRYFIGVVADTGAIAQYAYDNITGASWLYTTSSVAGSYTTPPDPFSAGITRLARHMSLTSLGVEESPEVVPAPPTGLLVSEDDQAPGTLSVQITASTPTNVSAYTIRYKQGLDRTFSGPTDGTEFAPETACVPGEQISVALGGFASNTDYTIAALCRGETLWSTPATINVRTLNLRKARTVGQERPTTGRTGSGRDTSVTRQ